MVGNETAAIRTTATCEFSACERPAERRKGTCHGELRLCAGHRKQWQRHGRLAPLKERPENARERVLEAARAWLDADTSEEADAEAERALRRFDDACRAWMVSLGWRPPHERELAAAGDASRAGVVTTAQARASNG
jgi:hypothetical protein